MWCDDGILHFHFVNVSPDDAIWRSLANENMLTDVIKLHQYLYACLEICVVFLWSQVLSAMWWIKEPNRDYGFWFNAVPASAQNDSLNTICCVVSLINPPKSEHSKYLLSKTFVTKTTKLPVVILNRCSWSSLNLWCSLHLLELTKIDDKWHLLFSLIVWYLILFERKHVSFMISCCPNRNNACCLVIIVVGRARI